MDLYLGIDLGGSHISGQLFDRDGKEYFPVLEVKINSNLDSAQLISSLVNVVKFGLFTAQDGGNNLIATGLASPGPLNPDEGIIVSPPNLPNIRNLEVLKWLRRRTDGLEIFLLNDADAAVLGEQWLGSAEGFKDVVMLTLGTGVGSGVMAGGKLQRGQGMGGEWGHTTLFISGEQRVCSCGRTNCLEPFLVPEG